MLPWYEVFLRLFLAAVLGGVVGIERERKEWTAGLRTHMLVCLGSALFMLVSSFGFEDIRGLQGVSFDPSRVAAQVVSGIGFLGAGTILFVKGGEVIKGLTTAAGLWTVAGIGLAIGGGMYIAAAITTGLVLIILALIRPYKNKIIRTFSAKSIRLRTAGGFTMESVNIILKEANLDFSNVTIEHSADKSVDIVHLYFNRKTNGDTLLKASDAFKQVEGVMDTKITNG